jgi:hypothetical protein
MADWLPIRVKTEPAKLRHVQNRIIGFPEEVMEKFYFQKLQSAVASAADVMRNYIEYSPDVVTPTGQARAALGGNGPGRKDTGRMIAGVKWRGGKVGKAKYEFALGWLNGEPGYSIFQEHGTKNGVQAMNSLQYASDFLRRELHLLGTNPQGYRVNNAAMWTDGEG